MTTTYLSEMLAQLLAENGELSAEQLAKALSSDEYCGKVCREKYNGREIPVENVQIVLFCRKIFGQSERTGRWGLRDPRLIS